MNDHYVRTQARQRALIDAAERLVLAHSKRTGINPRTLVNQIAEPKDALPSQQQREAENMIRALQRRLAKRDETGGGSGEGG